MGFVKECPKCRKTISAGLGYCWECWNSQRNTKQREYYCSCGMDITDHEYEHESHNGCSHPMEIEKPKKAKKVRPTVTGQHQELEHVEYAATFQDHEWTQIENKHKEWALDKLIDDALAQGNKELFLALTEQLKQLKEGVSNGG